MVSLLTLSIIRITIFEPVGIVQPVFAAFADAGLVTRSVPGKSLGSAPDVALRDVAAFDEDVVAFDEFGFDAVFSSPNWIC
ncbi:MAG: hypothetical protein DMG17_01025 [Acidobacteria bacterium]|nr:MAG: hypothetical protein DMG17_01025 [Acidobacteriota bacterium]